METCCNRRELLRAGVAVGAGGLAAILVGRARTARASAAPSRGPSGAASPLDGVEIDHASVAGKEGFWRVGKSAAGRWWLLRPDGRPFLYRAVVSVGPIDPPADAAAAKAAGKGLDRAAYWMDRLGAMGFNAFGEWTVPAMYDRGWPYTVLIHVRKATGNRWTVMPPKHIDVFDPAWRAAYDAKCKEVCTKLADRKDLLGYFVDNEASWAQARKDHVWGQGGDQADRNVLGKEPLLLQYFLALPPKRGGHKAAWEFVLKRHAGSVAQLARDWGAGFDSPAKLIELHGKGMVLNSRSFGLDQDAFTAHFVREYFRVTAETIRKYDANHLLLGCRHGAPPGEVVLKAYDPKHVDVLSFNNYRPNFRQRADEYRHANLPMLNGEFAWYSGHWPTRGLTAEVLASYRRRATAALENAFTHPNLVGYSWFKFTRDFTDADLPHEGLFNGTQINRFNVELLTKINPRLEGIALGRLEPTMAT
jgi:hypothetical protein